MYEVKAYHCSFCRKYGLSKDSIKKHEERCFRNPATRSCATCANLFNDDEAFSPVQCLAKIKFNVIDGEMDRLKLKTLCGLWVERPEDFEELTRYQDKMITYPTVQLQPKTNDIPF